MLLRSMVDLGRPRRSRGALSYVHVPQIHVTYPASRPWQSHGRFERYALWPNAGSGLTFDLDHWTAYYQFTDPSVSISFVGDKQLLSDERALWRIFVCKGGLALPSSRGSLQANAGDFIIGTCPESTWLDGNFEPNTTLIVKRTRAPGGRRALQVNRALGRKFLPYFYGHGKTDRFRSALLSGNPFGRDGDATVLVSFPNGTIASSHYHDSPIFHEFIYVAGGHLTPDGVYATGDHVTSIPGCKEGPWLATHDFEGAKLPEGWPEYARSRSREPIVAPWPNPFGDSSASRVFGLLFVHWGPFLSPMLGVNWTKLSPGELGPRG